MNLHEYQSKQLMASYGLPILPGHLCYTAGEVEAAADLLGGGICVVKAQVHAGGRGKRANLPLLAGFGFGMERVFHSVLKGALELAGRQMIHFTSDSVVDSYRRRLSMVLF